VKRLFVFALLGAAAWTVLSGSPRQSLPPPTPVLAVAAPSAPAAPSLSTPTPLATKLAAAPASDSPRFPPIDFKSLHARFGKADVDTTTAYDNPRPPLVTRTMVFNGHRLKVMMLADGKIGDPPPYERWLLTGLLDSKTGHVLSAEEVQRRLVETDAQSGIEPADTTAKVVLTAAVIAAAIVQESRSGYYAAGRPCACPDDMTRTGRRCGRNSAYSRPGGAQPLCYPHDVTAEMIEKYRLKKQASR